MNIGLPSPPKRLWVIAVMNIAVALLSLGLLAFMLSSPRVPPELRPGALSAVFSTVLGASLILFSILALLRYSQARWLALGSALLYYGILLAQTLMLNFPVGGQLDHDVASKLWAGTVRNSIEIALNLWVFLSPKTAAFFDSPNPSTVAGSDVRGGMV